MSQKLGKTKIHQHKIYLVKFSTIFLPIKKANVIKKSYIDISILNKNRYIPVRRLQVAETSPQNKTTNDIPHIALK